MVIPQRDSLYLRGIESGTYTRSFTLKSQVFKTDQVAHLDLDLKLCGGVRVPQTPEYAYDAISSTDSTTCSIATALRVMTFPNTQQQDIMQDHTKGAESEKPTESRPGTEATPHAEGRLSVPRSANKVSFKGDSGSTLTPGRTATCTTPARAPGALPPLHFTWKWKPIILYILFLIFCNLIIPVLLFYPLKHFTPLSTREIVGISSAALGVSSCFDAPLRLWRLTRHRRVYGPLGSDVWWHCDFVMWMYSIALIIFSVPLAIAPALELYDFFLMSTVLLVGPIGVIFLYSLFRPTLFCRCSSDPAGTRMKPAIFYCFEDFASVDFQHGRPFRKALYDRWNASPLFQKLMAEITMYWVISIAIYCGITAAVTWGSDLGFAFGWVLGQFFVWLIVSVVGSVAWAKRGLRKEIQWWTHHGHDTERQPEKVEDGGVSRQSYPDDAAARGRPRL